MDFKTLSFEPNITPVDVIKNQKSKIKDLSKGLRFIRRIKI